MLLLPGVPGGAYLDRDTILYGVVPTLLSVVLLFSAGWLWKSSGGQASLGVYVARAFLFAVSLVMLFSLSLALIAQLLQSTGG
jgi:hypothetical protein